MLKDKNNQLSINLILDNKIPESHMQKLIKQLILVLLTDYSKSPIANIIVGLQKSLSSL